MLHYFCFTFSDPSPGRPVQHPLLPLPPPLLLVASLPLSPRLHIPGVRAVCDTTLCVPLCQSTAQTTSPTGQDEDLETRHQEEVSPHWLWVRIHSRREQFVKKRLKILDFNKTNLSGFAVNNPYTSCFYVMN
jgi:hypothetical protein